MNANFKDLKDYLITDKYYKSKKKYVKEEKERMYNPNNNVFKILKILDEEKIHFSNKEWNKLLLNKKIEYIISYINEQKNIYDFSENIYNYNKKYLTDNIDNLYINFNLNNDCINIINIDIQDDNKYTIIN